MLKTDIRKVWVFLPFIDWLLNTTGKYYSMYFIIQDDADVEVPWFIFHYSSDVQEISCLQPVW